MAKDFKLNEHGDISFTDGQIDMVNGIEELAQCINLALSTPKGSFMNYEDYGLDTTFLINGFDEDAGLIAVRDCIMHIPKVISVTNLKCNVERERGSATFSFSIDSQIGSFNDKKEVPMNVK